MRSKRTTGLLLAALVGLAAVAVSAQGAVIGNWSGSLRSWNSPEMSSLKGVMTAAGHTVEADEAITAANLANDDIFVMGEPTTPTAGEIADLLSWLNGGGILLILADSAGTGEAGANATASGIGSVLSWGGPPCHCCRFPGVISQPPADLSTSWDKRSTYRRVPPFPAEWSWRVTGSITTRSARAMSLASRIAAITMSSPIRISSSS